MLAQTVAAASVVRLLEAEKESRGEARIPPVPAQVRRGRMGRTQPAVMLSRVCFWRVNLSGIWEGGWLVMERGGVWGTYY